MDSAEEMWKKFIKHLHATQPLGKPDKEGRTPPHMNFIGSIASYRKIFLEAQNTTPERLG
jgi:hypothetical protein